MAQGNNYGQTSNGVADESPNMLVYRKMEDVIARMQDEKNGIPIRTVKSFLSKIPSVFSGSDIVQWLIKNLTIEDPAVYLCKRTMQNKARLELADYEAESLARLQRAFARKWEFIFMQAEAQAKVDKKRDKIERKILDSQERAFWDVHRPVPGCVNTTEVDIKKSSRMRNPHKTRKSVYGLQNDIRSHSPTHTPTPETKPPTEDELQQQIKYWQIQLDRHRLKMSKVADSLLSYTEQYLEYDPFLLPPDPSNPWLSDDTTFWELEASKEPSQQRVKRWGFGMDEALKDPVGREQFLKFLESEFSSENLRFWLAVEDLKKRPIKEVPSRVQEIWQEFLAPGAPSAINLDSKSYDKTTQNVKEPGRYTFEDAQEHIYKLMKSDSYPRFIRSSAYQELLQAKKKGRNIPIFPCHKNCTPTLRASTNLL
ncbi:RGS7 isoform 1 [Pan troglodytes]|uniref:RGS7 isoform 1 n=8 Tax=Simiiformes TaxID=314293 RepID=A0A2J8TDN2_PONAB|nr:regulator of G-protein signaling 7 isoform 2 [Homo sapiens]XP_008984001.1 regulator of G-protein signaling 7 isoform X11 [Callithrix jacchus]XP_032098132.1 regulator of G-protein signaling 7 isoform X5 [Sapajus apella]XP_054516819.1 regulator of G-protein signaling 7 isoform X8 [Pan troglodytes]XP_055236325.1 regulator of G-protein signaling 7 isoform X6 [Gorilla gorilla gorilla]PNJ31086.1 RGS7 isoform 1 [Pongo abelii]KAI2521993.1 regulator of G protein signaling 7 [Homo sapiens]KAI408551|eukprot:NP_001269702.1 regulator of G-protein signaling 7 isoform 2 [Homo sapiens]